MATAFALSWKPFATSKPSTSRKHRPSKTTARVEDGATLSMRRSIQGCISPANDPWKCALRGQKTFTLGAKRPGHRCLCFARCAARPDWPRRRGRRGSGPLRNRGHPDRARRARQSPRPPRITHHAPASPSGTYGAHLSGAAPAAWRPASTAPRTMGLSVPNTRSKGASIINLTTLRRGIAASLGEDTPALAHPLLRCCIPRLPTRD